MSPVLTKTVNYLLDQARLNDLSVPLLLHLLEKSIAKSLLRFDVLEHVFLPLNEGKLRWTRKNEP
jgi:hypothetical protein